MKILLVHNRYRSTAPSGENRVVDQEREALAGLGHDVRLFERQSDEIEEWPAWKKATLPARVVWNPTSKRDLAAELESFRPDVVHVHNTFPVLSPSVLYACRAAKVPVVITLHNYKLLCASGDFYREGSVCHDCAAGNPLPAVRNSCYRGSKLATATTVLNTRSHRRSWRNLVSAYLFISDSQRQLLAGMDFDADRSFVRHNYVPYNGPLASEAKRQVAYVGRLDAAKGAPLLMKGWDAYREIAGDDALKLVIAGGGPMLDEVTAWAADRPSVELRGMLAKPDIFRLIGDSRAVVLPSEWEETFGLVVVEAMAVGVPLLASAHGSFPELVTAGVDGELFDPGRPAELAKLLLDVDTAPDKYAELGRNARTTYETRHDPTSNLQQLLDVYRFAIANPVPS
ncbi:glycosyltransferase [Kribbella sandramycini]|uniref:Glycosyltransferase n=1 Tax=Kribbella sandramycini TaxID=60450 RepID=A0A7Y4KUY0_9ACTN|nr:glycosyltransferase [Kribbella sandramycini]MBB6568398.1 glycosyltransferase involved in cell wall biosynthesis [Kribbella sandramycini]NOL39010.1 glycosyltransferase [Kribbella sandramycini]